MAVVTGTGSTEVSIASLAAVSCVVFPSTLGFCVWVPDSIASLAGPAGVAVRAVWFVSDIAGGPAGIVVSRRCCLVERMVVKLNNVNLRRSCEGICRSFLKRNSFLCRTL